MICGRRLVSNKLITAVFIRFGFFCSCSVTFCWQVLWNKNLLTKYLSSINALSLTKIYHDCGIVLSSDVTTDDMTTSCLRPGRHCEEFKVIIFLCGYACIYCYIILNICYLWAFGDIFFGLYNETGGTNHHYFCANTLLCLLDRWLALILFLTFLTL